MLGLDICNGIVYNDIVVGGDSVETERKSSQAHIDANARYDKKAYDRVLLRLRHDSELNLDAIRAYAESRGESVNGLITRAIAETIARDKECTESREPAK